MDRLTSFKDNCGFGLLASTKNIPSHKNVEDAITALERMMHRGAIAADGKSGDGSGLLFAMPEEFMRTEAKSAGVDLPPQFAVGMLFLSDESQKEVITRICERNDLKAVLFRCVPVNTAALGELALATLPTIEQVFVVPNSLMATRRFDAMLYLTRKEIEHELKDASDFYIPSFSSRVVVYKGLVMPTHIKEFYTDLSNPRFKASFALFHQRFSTNTLPKWRLAQPFRSIAHNGEINSVEANRYNVNVKSGALKSTVFTDEEMQRILPILQEGSSDSASLDNMFEFLTINGCDYFKAARSLVPAPWQNAPHMDPELRAFYEYTSTCFEAWDGPAAVSLTDGRYVGCVLDRNGLRPAKFILTKDDRMIIASEYGVVDVDDDNIIEMGRLQSGQMICADLKFGKVLKNDDINTYLKNSKPYDMWMNKEMVHLQEYIDANYGDLGDYTCEDLAAKQRYFNITHEVIDQVIKPMIDDGKEHIGSMGDDTPLAAFSNVQRSFSDYFKQKFAQVTNPPIDPYREKVVMSANTGFGEIHNILSEDPEHAKRLKTPSPVLSREELNVLLSFGEPSHARYDASYQYRVYPTTFTKDLKGSLDQFAAQIVHDVRHDGIRLVLLSDRAVDASVMTYPMALVVGTLNEVLLKEGLRHLVSIIAETGEVVDAHGLAVLLAYGVQAVYPYLLYATVLQEIQRCNLCKNETRKRLGKVHHALDLGILKIMSKMGIATVASYRNSSLFDVIGLSREIVENAFPRSVGLIGGLGYGDLEDRLAKAHQEAFSVANNARVMPLNMGGYYKYIDKGEYHDFSPKVVHAIHHLSETGRKEDYDHLKNLVDKRDKKMVRDFLEFQSPTTSISVDQVEPIEAIFKRFNSAAMSLGSISPEAHEALAEAMNRIGGMSNSGEGGEDPARFGTIKNSKIKQIASGRFGVTPAYLRSATEIQIKVAQGAKPGEGGQLPGKKVTSLIGRLRYTIPGVTLISPPPHHDIYSIEDLAQLIYDMKQINPDARVAVKLVSTAGVGTIAAGVAKAYADKIIISGGDGGTGAAPLTSIKFAGNPWELGLIEAHNALKVNHLREFVELQTDGGLKTGLDIVKAAMLGAESFAFGTGLLTVIGCKILRICHLNRCSVGIATQDEYLRGFYVGTVDKIINYLTMMAEDVRQILAELGYRSLDDVIGRNDLLKVIDDEFAKKFDFSEILRRIDGVDTCQKPSNEPFDKNDYEKEILEEVRPTLKNPEKKIVIERPICNLNRSTGTLISGEIAKYYGDTGLAEGTVTLKLSGIAGQSFGAFLAKGVSLYLDGVANDYAGKGMSGGRIVVVPRNRGDQFAACGNTCLYGATGGKFYALGSVGERFGVRNSGAMAVVEGTGDHACEYMTGGVVVILGTTGINFGAGMTGGVAFVYDSEKEFIDKMNGELIVAQRIDTDEGDEARHYLKKILTDYYNETKSANAKEILDNFRRAVHNFWMVVPKDMKAPLNPKEGN